MLNEQIKNFTTLITWTLLFSMANPAVADISVQNQRPADNFDFIFTETPELHAFSNQNEQRPGTFYLIGQYSFINHPLIEQLPNGSITNVVSSLHALDLQMGALITPRLSASVGLSFDSVGVSGSQSVGLGDSVIQLKYRLTDDGAPIAAAIIPDLYVPTGNSNLYLTNRTFGWGVKGAVARQLGALLVAANLGYRQIPGASWNGINYQHELILGLGGSVPVSQKWAITGEAGGGLSIPFQASNSPGEYLVGAKYQLSGPAVLNLGVSTGGFGSSNDGVRVIAGLKVALGPEPVHAALPVCSIESQTLSFDVRALSDEEAAAISSSLPYRALPISSAGDMTGVTSAGVTYVRNSQVVLAVDIDKLPASGLIQAIQQANLKLNVGRARAGSSLDTEMLCIPSMTFCSGQLSKKAMLAPGFSPDNALFSKIALDRPIGHLHAKDLNAFNLNVNIGALLEASGRSLSELLYDRDLPGLRKRTLYLVITDDLYVAHGGRMEIVVNQNKCN
jgi:hypothetical protein